MEKKIILKLKSLKLKLEVEKLHSSTLLNRIGPHLSCNLHKIGANLCSNLAFTHFLCKKVWSWVNGWMDVWVGGWVDARA